MWLTTIPWAHRIHGALPVLTALAPSERYHLKIGKPHKKITDWARQMILQLRRWLPHRRIVVVADSSYAALDLLHFCQSMQRPVTFITRLRRDAALYEPAPPRRPEMGRTRVKGQRLPTLKTLLDCPDTRLDEAALAWYDGVTRTVEFSSQTALWYHTGKPPVPIRWVLIRDPLKQFDSQALLCTDAAVVPVQIIEWFVLRWQIEVTFQEARAHLGVETQRQWSDRAIARTTPVLLGLFSWSLAAHLLGSQLSQIGLHDQRPGRAVSSMLALVRQVTCGMLQRLSARRRKTRICYKSQFTPLFNRFIESLAYAA